MHVRGICDRIVAECEASLSEKVSRAPRHLHEEEEAGVRVPPMPQKELF